MNDTDYKKIAKADKELKKAEEKNKEADKIYVQAADQQSGLTAEESDKLNNKAVLKQIEAGKIQFKARNLKYDVYAARVELFWIRNKDFIEKMRYANSLDNEAKSDFSNANDLYHEHESISDNLLKLGKLSDANDLMGKALEKMMKAFDLCANPPAEEPVVSQAPVETKADSVMLVADTTAAVKSNDSIIGKQETVQTASPEVKTDSTLVTEQKSEISQPLDTAKAIASEQPPVTPSQSESQKEPETITPAPNVEETKPEPIISTQKAPDETQVSPEAPIAKEPIRQQALEGRFFKVQIAASRVPLNAEQLAVIYTGEETPEEQLLNEWYKYTIGNFSDYESAAQLRDSCGVEGAFVVER